MQYPENGNVMVMQVMALKFLHALFSKAMSKE